MPDLLTQAEAALEARDITEALKLFSRAEQVGHDPDCCANGRWHCHMLLGNFELAWQESDAIESRGAADPNRFWDRGSLTGRRVLMRCLHGLGDSLQFLRFAPAIKRLAKSLSIEIQPALKSLLEDANDSSVMADDVLTWGEPEPEWDTQIEINELPRILRISLADIVAAPRWLACRPPARRKECPLRVGVVWAGGAFNPARSIHPGLIQRLLDKKCVEWISLQPSEDSRPVESLGFHTSPVSGKKPVSETAKVLEDIDLVITVDTMMAHLAGSMQIPVWTMLPFAADWRWLRSGTTTAWYPSMRLFRQQREGDWKTVVDEVAGQLDSHLQVGEHLINS